MSSSPAIIYPKISWAQNRRSIHVSFLLKNNSYGHPSIALTNQNKTITIQCQGCLPHENSDEKLHNFDISLNLFGAVLPIRGSDQIKITDRYIRIVLFKKAKKSWEKLISNQKESVEEDEGEQSTSQKSAEYYRKNLKTAILYDWDLDNVLERQMNEALAEAGMLDQDFSTSDEDDDDEDESQQNNRKKQKTSRLSKDPVYGEMSSSSSSSSDEEIEKENEAKKTKPEPKRQETVPQKQEKEPSTSIVDEKKLKEQQQIKQDQLVSKQIMELNKKLPAGQRRSLTDRNILMLVIVVGTMCGLIGALLSGTVVYWNMSNAVVNPEVLQQFIKTNNKKKEAQNGNLMKSDL